MPWKTPLTLMVRYLINDFSSTPETQKYSDEDLQRMIAISSIYASQDYRFANSYIIDIDNIEITPDPYDLQDEEFIALSTLKAACLFNINQYQGAVKNGIKVKSGDDSVDLTSGFSGYKDILSMGPCESYSALLRVLRSTGSGKPSGGEGFSRGRAVANLATHPDSGYYGNGVVRFYNSFNDRGGGINY